MTFPYPIPRAQGDAEYFVADNTHQLGTYNHYQNEARFLRIDYSKLISPTSPPVLSGYFSFKISPGGMPSLTITNASINPPGGETSVSMLGFSLTGGIAGVTYTITITIGVNQGIRTDILTINVMDGDNSQNCCTPISPPPATGVNLGGLQVVNDAVHYTVSNTAPVNPTVLDQWFLPGPNVVYEYITNGTTNSWLPLVSPVQEAPEDGFAYVRTNSGWVSGGTFAHSITTNGDMEAVGWILTKNGLYVDDVSGAPKTMYTRTNGINRWAIGQGGGTETGGNAGANFRIWAYDDNGNTLPGSPQATGTPMYLERASGQSIWSGPITITPPYANTGYAGVTRGYQNYQASLNLVSATPTASIPAGSAIYGSTMDVGGLMHTAWIVSVGDSAAPISGQANTGKNFSITSCDDSGSLLNTGMHIDRATAATTFGGTIGAIAQMTVTGVTGGPAGIRLFGHESGDQLYFQSAVRNTLRWGLYLGNGDLETGSNSGTDFELLSFDDTGNPLKEALFISRATGLVTLVGDPTTALGAATKGYVDGVAISSGAVLPSTVNPEPLGTANPGTSPYYSRGDHVHPTDTTRAPIASPTLTGTVTSDGDFVTLGPNAAYFWYDRAIPGQQWAWYATGGHAYLWNNNPGFADILDINYTTGAINFDFPVTFNNTTQAITPVSSDSSTNVATTAFVHGVTGSYLPLTGGTLTGNLVVAPSAVGAAAGVTLSSNLGNNIVGTVHGASRWLIALGDGEAESTGDAGSNFVIEACHDSGAIIGQPITINRASMTTAFGGAVNLHADPTIPLGAATKQYVDNTIADSVGGGFANKLRNGTMDIWQRGVFITIPPNGLGYTADGWMILSGSGAQTTVQRSTTTVHGLTLSSMQLVGVAGLNACTLIQRIESSIAAALDNNISVTFQAQIYNPTGTPFTPQLQISHPSIQDWGSGFTATVDVGPVSLQTCAAVAWTQVAYTFQVPNAVNGMEVDILFGNALNGNWSFYICECDLRVTPDLPVGLCAHPPTPELRPIYTELAFCQRYYETSYGNLIQPGATVPAPGFVQVGLSLGGSVTITYMDTQIWFKIAKRVNNPSLYLWSYNSGVGGLVTSGSGSIAKAYDALAGVDVQVALANTNISASHCTVALIQHIPGPAIDVIAGWAVSAEL